MVDWADDAYASGAYRDYVEARPMKIRHFEDRMADTRQRASGRASARCRMLLRILHGGRSGAWLRRARCGILAGRHRRRECRHCGRASSKGVLETMPDKGLFDVVSAFDLIEHVPDPRRSCGDAAVCSGRVARS